MTSGHSKQLGHDDTSGHEFSSKLFENLPSHIHSIGFDRILFNHATGKWVLIDHIVIDHPIDDAHFVDEDIFTGLQHKMAFARHLAHIAPVSLDIQFFCPSNLDTVQRLKGLIDHPQPTLKISSCSLEDYVRRFRHQNFGANPENRHKTPHPSPFNRERFLTLLEKHDAFHLSKSCLMGDKTFGFNIDHILFDTQTNKVSLMEFLKCEASQPYVTPLTSHPNKYWHKNAQKFISLHRFANTFGGTLYGVNYAENGPHVGLTKMFEICGVDENDSKEPCKTNTVFMTRTDDERAQAMVNFLNPQKACVRKFR